MNATAAGDLPLPMLIAGGTVAGLIAGSFIGALVSRWPRGESVVHGRSHCDSCGHGLRARDLVPVLSYVALRGRCRECGARILAAHLVAELGAALVGATAFAVAPPPEALTGLAFGWTLVALALLDARHLWLPDRLTLPLAAAGVAASALDFSPSLTDSLIGAAAGYAALTLIALAYQALRKRRGLGGGDPKLLGAIGAWLGWPLLPPVLLLASLAGLAAVALSTTRGTTVSGSDKLPLGTLMALAAWPLWLVVRVSLGP